MNKIYTSIIRNEQTLENAQQAAGEVEQHISNTPTNSAFPTEIHYNLHNHHRKL